jgi:hypothetical protein
MHDIPVDIIPLWFYITISRNIHSCFDLRYNGLKSFRIQFLRRVISLTSVSFALLLLFVRVLRAALRQTVGFPSVIVSATLFCLCIQSILAFSQSLALHKRGLERFVSLVQVLARSLMDRRLGAVGPSKSQCKLLVFGWRTLAPFENTIRLIVREM